jgi:hypothetical protein
MRLLQLARLTIAVLLTAGAVALGGGAARGVTAHLGVHSAPAQFADISNPLPPAD